ncbi:CHAT domain-containing protein [Rubripirellula tenax]|uniref:CHAT domain-containing protein n=1 Tax=Rubripirellula tenax TaxID=2528015 RepID=UPI001645D96A|nr:CHAT domain-containing protein [Rubripirellula tenax]
MPPTLHSLRYSLRRRFAWLAAAALSFCLFSPSQAVFAQGQGTAFGTLGGVEPTGQYPPQTYYLALGVYRGGDLPSALNAFEAALRGSRRNINGRMIDAIPALAMMGECHWHLGNVPAAREISDQVYDIATRYQGWLSRVDWNSTVQMGVQRTKPNWLWPDAASVNLIATSDRMMFLSGNRVTEQSLVAGGAIEELNVRSMDIIEIMRGIATASYRRRIILGPLSEEDSMAVALVSATKFPANLNIPVARSLIGSMRTAGYFSEHDEKSVVAEAARSSTPGGVHPLSPIAMLCQASTLAASANPDDVIPIAANVANAAAVLEQPEWIGEAMQLAAGCTSPARAATVAQMATVAAGSLSRQSRLGTLHCLIAAADAAVTAGDPASASGLLGQAQALSSRRDVIQPRLEAYGAYVLARIAAANGATMGSGKVNDLDKALSSIEGFALRHADRKRSLVSMPRIYQLGLVTQMAGSNVGASTGSKWLKMYCDEPSIDVWRRDPVDAIAGLILDRAPAHAMRINLAAASGYAEDLLQASDAMLAARFVDRQPIGGRILQARAIAGGDDQLLAPEIAELRKAAGPLMAELRGAAINRAEPDAAVAQMMEAKATLLAINRTSLPQVAVPTLDPKLPIAKLGPRTAMLTYTHVGNRLYATLSADGKVVMWNVAAGNRIPGDISRLMMSIGVGKTRGKRLPEDDEWKTIAVSIRQKLFPEGNQITAERFDELIIVPDGPLWYLPFELLPIGEPDSPLISEKIAIRYAPTPGIAVKPTAMPATSRVVGITTDQFFAPRDVDLNASIVDSVVDVIKEPLRLPDQLNVPTGLVGDRVGHLVVASARPANLKNPLATGLATYDQSSPYGTVEGWLRFPVGSPASVVLFGLRTSIDIGQIGSGDELFTTLVGLHVAGARSVLLSRWAVGGESSAMLLREFLQELPFMGMNESWRRATTLIRQRELDPTAEPLLMQSEHDRQGITGDQPLFWSGYLVSSPPHPTAE